MVHLCFPHIHTSFPPPPSYIPSWVGDHPLENCGPIKSLKKTDPLSLKSHQLSIAPQLGVKAHKPHQSVQECRLTTVLCRWPCCCEVMSVTVLSSPEAGPVLLDPWILHPHPPSWELGLVGGRAIQTPHEGLSILLIFSLCTLVRTESCLNLWA